MDIPIFNKNVLIGKVILNVQCTKYKNVLNNYIWWNYLKKQKTKTLQVNAI